MKMNILFFVFAFVLLLPANPPRAEEVKTFVYDSNGKRDPFIPPVAAAVAASEATDVSDSTEEKAAANRPDLILEGIIYDPAKGSFALIDGELLKVGERISECTIVKIEKTIVTLSFNEEIFNLELKVDEPSKLAKKDDDLEVVEKTPQLKKGNKKKD